MTRRIIKSIICTIAVMCVLCSSLTAFAENGDGDFDFNIQPIEPTTQEEVFETESTTQEQTEAPTEKPTKKPAKPTTTRPQENPMNNGNSNNNAGANAEPKTEKETETTTENTLPEGAFYVYLERNNGEKRLKTLMKKEGLLIEPEKPIREGYVFDGWYKDSGFKELWNFSVDTATEEMTIYAKWIADPSTVVYNIIIENTVGGKLEANPAKASEGEPVFITVTPDEGKRLVAGSLLINGKSTDVFSFVMPKGKVTITASFEDIPQSEEEDGKKSVTPFIAVGGVIVVLIIVVAIIIAKRRSDYNADLDEDFDDNSEDVGLDWSNASMVVEDGFKEGKKVVENAEPDYGAAEPDNE